MRLCINWGFRCVEEELFRILTLTTSDTEVKEKPTSSSTLQCHMTTIPASGATSRRFPFIELFFLPPPRKDNVVRLSSC